ncbi:unnamed protein product [Cochlearia groenlandica]
MYYQNQQQGKNILSSSRMHIPNDQRHPIFLRGGNSPRDSGLILSTDAKPRLKWTPDLHERFIEAVNQLGGADKATPKTIMKVMGIQGLTLYHLKSHLQKYRLSKNLNGQTNTGFNKTSKFFSIFINRIQRYTQELLNFELHERSKSKHGFNSPISEALQVQIEVQRRLHEQLEVQRHLQLRIEAQGKYLQSVLEKAQETLGRQNLGEAGLEAAKVQLSELVSKVTSEYPNSSFIEQEELQNIYSQQMQTTYPPKVEESNRLGLRTYLGDSTSSEQKEIIEEPLFQRMELTWTEGLRRNPYLSTMVISEAEQRRSYSEASPGRLSIGMQGNRGHQESNNECIEERFKDRSEEHKLGRRCTNTEIDLNTNVENYCTARPKQFDLNGFSWN